jgi:hypothetical protein
LVVWQVRHALLNISCPDPASAPARAGSWGTAEDDSRIRNVEQASPTIGIRGMKASIPQCVPCNRTRGGDNKFFHMRDRRDAIRHKIAQHFRKVNHTNAAFRGSNPRRRDGRKHASRQRTGLRGKFPAIEFFARALDAREGAPENRYYIDDTLALRWITAGRSSMVSPPWVSRR